MNPEIRSFGSVEYRASETGGPGRLAGYALKYDKLSRDLGGFVERVAAGAVDKSLADGLDVMARYNHDDDKLLGRTSSGTLTLRSDDTGLWYEAELPDTQWGRDVAALAARGDVSQSSFAFYTIDDDWSETEAGYPLRTLNKVRLVDVAPVNTPAYPDTSVAMRSLDEHKLATQPTGAGEGPDEQGETHSAVPVRLRIAELDQMRSGWQGDTHRRNPITPTTSKEK